MTAWRQDQRTKSYAFYAEVQATASAAKGYLNDSVTQNDYDYTADDAVVGLTSGAAGAAKDLKAKLDAANGDGGADGKGLLFYTPLTRNAIGAGDSEFTYSMNAASVEAWNTAQTANSNSNGAVKLWWAAVDTLSAAVDLWHTTYDDGAKYDIGGSTAAAAFLESDNQISCDMTGQTEWA
jgi:hypothetical protein